MEWYTEGVTNAIMTCRQQNALFIVYIKGKVTHLNTRTYVLC